MFIQTIARQALVALTVLSALGCSPWQADDDWALPGWSADLTQVAVLHRQYESRKQPLNLFGSKAIRNMTFQLYTAPVLDGPKLGKSTPRGPKLKGSPMYLDLRANSGYAVVGSEETIAKTSANGGAMSRWTWRRVSLKGGAEVIVKAEGAKSVQCAASGKNVTVYAPSEPVHVIINHSGNAMAVLKLSQGCKELQREVRVLSASTLKTIAGPLKLPALKVSLGTDTLPSPVGVSLLWSADDKSLYVTDGYAGQDLVSALKIPADLSSYEVNVQIPNKCTWGFGANGPLFGKGHWVSVDSDGGLQLTPQDTSADPLDETCNL